MDASTEPVALAELVRLLLVALVGLGWLTIDDPAINTVASAVGLLLSWVLTAIARSKVKPMSKATS